jgi:hypothetical protein
MPAQVFGVSLWQHKGAVLESDRGWSLTLPHDLQFRLWLPLLQNENLTDLYGHTGGEPSLSQAPDCVLRGPRAVWVESHHPAAWGPTDQIHLAHGQRTWQSTVIHPEGGGIQTAQCGNGGRLRGDQRHL